MDVKLEFFMCGGSKNTNHYLDDADNVLNNKDNVYISLYNDGKKYGKKIRNKTNIEYIEPPTPIYKVNPFRMNLEY